MTSSLLFAQYSIVPRWVTTWLTPLWLIGIGILAGLLILLLLWALLFLVSRKTAREIPNYLSEGVMPGMLAIACLFAIGGLVATITVKEPAKMIGSLRLLSSSGESNYSGTISESVSEDTINWEPVAVNIDPGNFRGFIITSTEPVLFSYDANPEETISPTEIDPTDGLKYSRSRTGSFLLTVSLSQIFISPTSVPVRPT